MASDFSISQFRFLERLLVVHGHWCYKRIAQMVLPEALLFLTFHCILFQNIPVYFKCLYQVFFSLNCRSATSFTRILPLGLQYFTLRRLLGFLGNLYTMIGLCCFSMLFLPRFLLYHLECLSKMFLLKSAYRYTIEQLTYFNHCFGMFRIEKKALSWNVGVPLRLKKLVN